MSFKNLIIPCLSILILNACNNSKPNQQDIKNNTSSSEITTQTNHLFNEGITTHFLELKPTYMGEDLSKVDSSQFVFASIIRKDGIDTNFVRSSTVLSNASKLSQLQVLLNDTSTSRTALECYTPRHGIAWYDSKNELEAFLEICFECNDHKTWGSINIEGQKSGAWFGRLERLFSLYRSK